MIRVVPSMCIKRTGMHVDEFSECLDINVVKSKFRTGHTICEYLHNNTITKLFFDFEKRVPLTSNVEYEIETTRQLLIRHLNYMCELLRNANDQNKGVDIFYRIASRHGKDPSKPGEYKISFRPFFSGIRIKYTDIPKLINRIYENNEEIKKIDWDLSVYKPSEQLLAAIMGKKDVKDGRILEMENPDDKVEWYIAQYTEDSWEICDLGSVETNNNFEIIGNRIGRLNITEELCEEVEKLLSSDKGLQEVLKVNGPITFNKVSSNATYATIDLYLYKHCGAICLIENRRHAKNNGSIKVCYTSRRILYHCYDDTCRNINNYQDVDITGSVKCIDQIFSAHNVLEEDPCTQIMKCLVSKWPDTFFAKLNKETFSVKIENKANYHVILFEDSGSKIEGIIYPDYSVHVEGNRFKLIGELSPGLIMKEIGRIDKDIDNNASFGYSRDTDTDTATLKGTDDNGSTKITILSPYSEDPKVRVTKGGRPSKNINTKDTKWLMNAITESAKRHAELNHGLKIFQMNFNGPTTIINADFGDVRDFPVLRKKILDYAEKFRLCKTDEYIYEPIYGCPCAYKKKCDFKTYINDVLEGDEVYTSNPKRFDDAKRYLQNYRDKELPILAKNKNLISFLNGVLELDTTKFTPYEEVVEGHPFHGNIARNHIPSLYTGSSNTPLLDQIFAPQFDDDVATHLCGLIGRLFFDVGQMDNWQVMPYLVGVGGTGKSVVLTIISKMFGAESVATISGGPRETVFGLDNLHGYELIIGRDMPSELSKAISQEHFQSMTSGEGMEIARKGEKSVHLEAWTTPCIMSSNHMPDYVNTGNNVSRRIVTYRFDTVIKSPQENLLKLILDTELPNIVCRCLHSYLSLRKKINEQGSFWQVAPKSIVKWQRLLAAATNKLYAFLEMEDDERGCKIEHVPDHVTWWTEFKELLESKMGRGAIDKIDPAVFDAFSFSYSNKMENVCKSCKQIAKGRHGKCCEHYSITNRAKKNVIYNMKVSYDQSFAFE